MSKRIAVSHPGKIGDLLWCLPTARWLAADRGCQVDFYTSKYCRAVVRTLEYQSCINKVVVLEDYEASGFAPGVQPWPMSVPEDEYDEIHHLGFKSFPDRDLGEFTAWQNGAPKGLEAVYEYPESSVELPTRYYVMAPRGDAIFQDALKEFVRRSPIPVVQIGAAGEGIEADALDLTGLDILETLPILAGSSGFVGLASSPLVLAAGFRIPRVTLVQPYGVDGRHFRIRPGNRYLSDTSADNILRMLGDSAPLSLSVTRTLPYLVEDRQHLVNVRNRMGVKTVDRLPDDVYAHIIFALRLADARRVAVVGDCGSILTPAYAWLHSQVVQVGADADEDLVKEQASRMSVADRVSVTADAVGMLDGVDALVHVGCGFDDVPDFGEYGCVPYGGMLILQGVCTAANMESVIEAAVAHDFYPYRGNYLYSEEECPGVIALERLSGYVAAETHPLAFPAPQVDCAEKIFVGIPVLNRIDLLEKAVASIDVPAHVFVVNNNTYDKEFNDRLEALKRERGLDVYSPRYNLGVAAAWNRIVTQAMALGYTSVYISSNDTVFKPGTLRYMEDDVPARDGDAVWMLNGFHAFRVNVAALSKVGMFDENFYPAYFEDNDFIYRCGLAGVRHYSPATDDGDGKFRLPAGLGVCSADPNGAGSQTIASDPVYAQHNRNTFGSWNASHYRMKWGGMPGAEVHSIPYGGDLAHNPLGMDHRWWPDPGWTLKQRDWDNGRERLR